MKKVIFQVEKACQKSEKKRLAGPGLRRRGGHQSGINYSEIVHELDWIKNPARPIWPRVINV